MPELDGYAAAARLRAAGYRGPIVALTAHAMEDERARCLGAGCDGFAAKPILRRTLIEVARAYLAPAGAAPLVSALAADPEIARLLDGFVGRLPERLGAMEVFLKLAVLALARERHDRGETEFRRLSLQRGAARAKRLMPAMWAEIAADAPTSGTVSWE